MELIHADELKRKIDSVTGILSKEFIADLQDLLSNARAVLEIDQDSQEDAINSLHEYLS